MLNINENPSSSTIIRELNGNPKTGMACCPAHDDKNPSLSVTEKNGKVLVKCQSGCSQYAVIEALKAKNLWPVSHHQPSSRVRIDASPSSDFEEYERQRQAFAIMRTAAANESNEPLEAYFYSRGINSVPDTALYLNATQSGRRLKRTFPAIVFPVIHENKGLTGAHVTWLQRDRKAKLKAKNPRKMLGVVKGGYVRLGKRAKNKSLIVGEGVETVLAAMQATGLPGIAALSASNLKSITIPPCKDVIIAADNDRAGLEAANALKKRLLYEGIVVRIAVPENVGEDWNDVLQDSNDDDLVGRQIKSARRLKPPKGPSALTIDEYLNLNFPPRENLLAPWLKTNSIGMVYAKPGAAKTFLMLSVAQAVASGGVLMDWVCERPANVLFVDGELPGFDLQERLKLIEPKPPTERLMIVSLADLVLRGHSAPDIGTEEGRSFLDKIIERHKSEFIILDSLTTLRRSGEENAAEDWRRIQDWLIGHRQQGRTVVFLHHENKAGTSRGSSTVEVVLDFAMRLERLADECTDEYSTSKLTWTKTRSIWGEDARERIIKMSTLSGAIEWEFEYIELQSDQKLARVVELLNSGMKQTQIAKELNLSKGRISQLVTKAKKMGLV